MITADSLNRRTWGKGDLQRRFPEGLNRYYRGGGCDYLPDSNKELDLLHKRFIVFELDNIKDHKILFPVTTIIIMEAFLTNTQVKGDKEY